MCPGNLGLEPHPGLGAEQAAQELPQGLAAGPWHHVAASHDVVL